MIMIPATIARRIRLMIIVERFCCKNENITILLSWYAPNLMRPSCALY